MAHGTQWNNTAYGKREAAQRRRERSGAPSGGAGRCAPHEASSPSAQRTAAVEAQRGCAHQRGRLLREVAAGEDARGGAREERLEADQRQRVHPPPRQRARRPVAVHRVPPDAGPVHGGASEAGEAPAGRVRRRQRALPRGRRRGGRQRQAARRASADAAAPLGQQVRGGCADGARERARARKRSRLGTRGGGAQEGRRAHGDARSEQQRESRADHRLRTHDNKNQQRARC